MERKCVVCHDNAALFRCIQCHKPVCDDCAFKTEHGAFCSRECAAAYREFKRSQPASLRRRLSTVKPLIGLALAAAIAAALAWKMGWLTSVPGLPSP